MNPTASRTVIAKTIPWGWSFVFYLLTVIAALALAAPYAHAATLTTGISGTATPGATVTATGMYTLGIGETFVSSHWSQVADDGVTVANISTPDKTSDTGSHATDVTLGSASDYVAYLVKLLKTPPITLADLPPTIKVQQLNEINKGLQDSTQVVAITPKSNEEAETVVLRFLVTTSNGDFTEDVTVTTELPWVINPGVRTVPISDMNHPDQSVLLIAKCGEVPVLDPMPPHEPTGEYECEGQTTFAWQLTTKPGGSTAVLTGANTRTPWFAPDKTGTYELTVMASGGTEDPYTDTLEVHAGLYHGVIDPTLTLNNLLDGTGNYNGDGRPETDEDCLNCHFRRRRGACQLRYLAPDRSFRGVLPESY